MPYIFDPTPGLLQTHSVSKHNAARASRFEARIARRKAKRSPNAAKRLARRQARP